MKILAERYTVRALFAPEHGLYGCENAGTVWDSANKPISGMPLYSLYRQDGQDFKPDTLTDIDTLVYDIQDVGARFYTYISTLILAMRAASMHGKAVIVLDRPNPLGGVKVEGNIVKKSFESFIGMYPLCIRYGLTAAELARMVHTNSCAARCTLCRWNTGTAICFLPKPAACGFPPPPTCRTLTIRLPIRVPRYLKEPMYPKAEVRRIRLPLLALRT